jgi:lysophospholipase L1-like esterase
MIHCIGDSHSAVFSGEENMQPIWPTPAANKLPYFRSYRIGPATAYQLENKIPTINEIIKQISEGDKVMFCFGEVDIRAHLLKQSIEQNKPVGEIIIECVNRYFEVIKTYKNNGLDIIIWGPIASWNANHPYTGGPSYGTNIERNEITRHFTETLKTLADAEGIPLVTIFYDMLNEDGTTNSFFLDDWDGSHMHLSQRAMSTIVDKFKNEHLL